MTCGELCLFMSCLLEIWEFPDQGLVVHSDAGKEPSFNAVRTSVADLFTIQGSHVAP